jgi:hypothetical protein
VIDAGMVTLVKPDFRNAPTPMDMTELAMVTLVRTAQL